MTKWLICSLKSLHLAERLGHTPQSAGGEVSQPGDLWNGLNSIGPLVYSILKAQTYLKDVDYIVRDGKVVILSPNTGRAMEKSRWNEGMHQVFVLSFSILEADKLGLIVSPQSILCAETLRMIVRLSMCKRKAKMLCP